MELLRENLLPDVYLQVLIHSLNHSILHLCSIRIASQSVVIALYNTIERVLEKPLVPSIISTVAHGLGDVV